MSANTKIEWADHTFNPWEGCQKVGPGCDHCYAETRNARFGGGVAVNWGPGAPRRRTSEANWRQPIKWNAEAGRLGMRYRVFCASLADVFDNAVEHKWRADLMALIRDTPNLDWLLLTKRIGNALGMLNRADDDLRCPLRKPAPDQGFEWPLANVWLGATIVNQEEADRDIPKLLAVPAAKRFLSMEPLLGPVDLRYIDINGDCEIYPLKGTTDCVDGDFEPAPDLPALDWVIVGGESGPGARPMHPDWARDLRDQCEKAGVPFLFKQWGDWCPRGPESLGYPSVDGVPRFRMTDAGGDGQDLGSDGGNEVWMNRAGKKAAGRLLDGRTWDGFPS